MSTVSITINNARNLADIHHFLILVGGVDMHDGAEVSLGPGRLTVTLDIDEIPNPGLE